MDVNTLYTKLIQAQTLLQIQRNESIVDKHFDFTPRSTKFFSRGHLAPNSDFVDKASQESTFNFINAAVNQHIKQI